MIQHEFNTKLKDTDQRILTHLIKWVELKFIYIILYIYLLSSLELYT